MFVDFQIFLCSFAEQWLCTYAMTAAPLSPQAVAGAASSSSSSAAAAAGVSSVALRRHALLRTAPRCAPPVHQNAAEVQTSNVAHIPRCYM